MDPFTILLALGTIASVVGAGVQAYGSMQEAQASKDAEALRQKQMLLESNRQRLQTIRQSIAARAQAENNATAQGAQSGSGLAGGEASIGAKTANNLVGISQGVQIGTGIFQANSRVADAQSLAAFGQGLGSMGDKLSGIHFGDH